jgi:hypothetical protein
LEHVSVKSGESSTIGWLTSGMQKCVVSSPDMPDFTAANASNTSVNGMATTSPLTDPARILLTCTTIGGATKSATTTVSVVGKDDPDMDTFSLDVSSTLDGSSNVKRGSSGTFTWSTVAAPGDARLSLWLYDVRLGVSTVLIKDDLPVNGTFSWTLPKPGDACDDSDIVVCASDLVPGRTYGVEADLYRPNSDPEKILYYGYTYTPDTFKVTE